jgi:hypothetical protein
MPGRAPPTMPQQTPRKAAGMMSVLKSGVR